MIVGIVAVNKIMFRLIEELSIRVRLVCVCWCCWIGADPVSPLSHQDLLEFEIFFSLNCSNL